MKGMSNKALLSTSNTSGRIYLYIAVLIILMFFYYVFTAIYKLQAALQNEENAIITNQLLQHRATLKKLNDL